MSIKYIAYESNHCSHAAIMQFFIYICITCQIFFYLFSDMRTNIVILLVEFAISTGKYGNLFYEPTNIFKLKSMKSNTIFIWTHVQATYNSN